MFPLLDRPPADSNGRTSLRFISSAHRHPFQILRTSHVLIHRVPLSRAMWPRRNVTNCSSSSNELARLEWSFTASHYGGQTAERYNEAADTRVRISPRLVSKYSQSAFCQPAPTEIGGEH
ncbi:hypothetical protein DPEC_G00349070 [Dallia pectoralis]|uniref:Uncharacterized protein n=1 Tax=Dallia pectoralis TaxID=75939 RepID=A0ACC2F1D4_DALPE|nr:hypothetical protein DPEC_G00349070 [Dallia pectoralis]